MTRGAPDSRQFWGQPAKALGDWLRSQGEARFERLAEPMTHTFAWGNNEKRETLKGRCCRVVLRGTAMRSVLIELENGQREVVSYRALKQL